MKQFAYHLLPGLVLGLLTVTGGTAAETPRDAAPKAKRIEVVICLDTSNSMDGLIAAAKLKLWDIVNDLARIQPTPDLHVGLYSYGNDSYDRRAGWVRKENDLTTDLDAVYDKLNRLTTNGGTELVARVCRDALDQLKWSAGKEILKIIFVCGNEPASQDREVSLQVVADKAIGQGVVINPIYCGRPSDPAASDWKSFATMTRGQFASIDQDRGTVVIETPVDKDLKELSEKLSTTYVPYGRQAKDKAENQQRQDVNAYNLGQAAAATRAVSKATALYRNADWDLVDRVKEDPKFDITKLADAELPAELRNLRPEKRIEYVKEMAAKRLEMQKQITELNNRRQAYVAEQMKKNPSQADRAFDAAIRKALREQAAQKGIVIPE